MYPLLKFLLRPLIRLRDQAGAPLPQLEMTRPVIYVLYQDSLIDAMAADLFLATHRFPPLRRKHSPGQPSVIALLTRRGHPRTESIARLVDANANQERPAQLVPISIFWGRAPTRRGSFLKLALSDRWAVTGPMRKFFTLLVNGRAAYVEVHPPVLPDEVGPEDSSTRRARKIHRVLRVHFHRVRQRVIGPDLSHRRTLKLQILNSAAVRVAITQHASSKRIALTDARDLASQHLQEIMADVSHPTIRVLDRALAWLWNRIYNGVDIHNIEPVKQAAGQATLVYVPCHRSHIDYLLLSYCLYHQGLTIPHIAAGKNLNMPLVGPLLRRGGAFFMRRSFGRDKLYTRVFNEYLHQMLTRRMPVEYFVEGGRSRTGRTLDPRAGMLNMTVQSQLRAPDMNLALIPVYIGYEKVFEGNSYLKELRGRSKEKESVFRLVRVLRRLRHYGKVNLNFGEPIDLRHHLDTTLPGWDQAGKPQATGLSASVNLLGRTVVERINAAAAFNPINLIALALLSSQRMAMSHRALCDRLSLFRTLLQAVPYSNKVSWPAGDPEDWIATAESLRVVRADRLPLDTIHSLDSHHAVLMTYYRNNILHLFAIPALLCCGLLVHDRARPKQALLEQVSLIYPYVRDELHLHWSPEELGQVAERYLSALQEQALIRSVGQRLQVADAPNARAQFMALARLMLPTLERYYLTLATLNAAGSGVLSAPELESRAQQLAQMVSVLNGLNAPEFFDQSLIKGFIRRLREHQAIWPGADERLEFDLRIRRSLRAAESVLEPELVRNVQWHTQQPETPAPTTG